MMRRKGARLLLGGESSAQGNWFEPTVFARRRSFDGADETSFGPIIGIEAVADDEAAIDLMNDTQYGLTAGVYTGTGAPKKFAQVHAGTVAGCCDRGPRPRSGVENSASVSRFIDLRHPDIHAPEGMAPQVGVNGRTRPPRHLRAESLGSAARSVLAVPRRDRHRSHAAGNRRDPRGAILRRRKVGVAGKLAFFVTVD
jgi:hypothetical protein